MFKDLYKKFKNENIVGRFIYINVAVYVIVAFIGVFATLFNVHNFVGDYIHWLELPASFEQFICQPWSIFTYMFLHERIMHILWNMLLLYGIGRIFLSFFSLRHFVGVYILGGLVGGLFFMLAFNVFPYFDGATDGAYLLGASASVLAVVVASAVRSPNYTVNLMLFGSIRLMTVAVVIVVVSMLLLTSENSGGHFAHLGGAFAGWLFAYMLNKGKDVVSPINKIIDFFATFSLKKRPATKNKFNYSRGGRAADYEYNAKKKKESEEIDKILEKVKASGYSSLSDEEKKRLFDASQS